MACALRRYGVTDSGIKNWAFNECPIRSKYSSFGVRFCTIFLVEGSPQLDFRRNLPASDLFGLVTHSRFLLSLSK
jgi:hypothetical protein